MHSEGKREWNGTKKNTLKNEWQTVNHVMAYLARADKLLHMIFRGKSVI
jgi:hypothetical protein